MVIYQNNHENFYYNCLLILWLRIDVPLIKSNAKREILCYRVTCSCNNRVIFRTACIATDTSKHFERLNERGLASLLSRH